MVEKWHWDRVFPQYFCFLLSGIIPATLHTHLQLNVTPYQKDKSAKPGIFKGPLLFCAADSNGHKLPSRRAVKRSQLACVCVSQHTQFGRQVLSSRCPLQSNVLSLRPRNSSLISTKKRVWLSPDFSDPMEHRISRTPAQRLFCSNMQTHSQGCRPEGALRTVAGWQCHCRSILIPSLHAVFHTRYYSVLHAKP